MVGGVDGGEPRAEGDGYGDDGPHEHARAPLALEEEGGVEAHDADLGGVERGECPEDIGAARVDALEEGGADERVEAQEARRIARRRGEDGEPVLHHVPGGGGGVEALDGEPDGVGQQEDEREAEGAAVHPLEIEVEGEENGDGHPADVAHARHDVRPRPVVGTEILGEGQRRATVGTRHAHRRDAEDGALELVERTHVDGGTLREQPEGEIQHPIEHHGPCGEEETAQDAPGGVGRCVLHTAKLAKKSVH